LMVHRTMNPKKKTEPNADTLSNRLVDQIYADIVAAGLQEGDRFMTVDQVVQQYGVSRTIVREAVSQLRALGVLKSRQRVGLLVDRPDLVGFMARWIPFYVGSPKVEDLRRLAQLRYVLELGSVDFAVANATPEQVRHLNELAERFENLVANSGQTSETDQVEFEFHCLLLTMTRNPLISGMHRVLSDYFHAAPQSNPHWSEIAPSTVWEHRAIANAVERGDTEYVRGLLRRHLEKGLTELESQNDRNNQAREDVTEASPA